MVWKEFNLDEIPIDELLLFECEIRDINNSITYEYHSGNFKLTMGKKTKIGVIGGRFHFDWTILRWKSIQHLIED